jgi:hypothetical protein
MLFVGVAIVCNPLQKLSALTYPGFTLEYIELRNGRASVSAYSALPLYVCISYVCIGEEQ